MFPARTSPAILEGQSTHTHAGDLEAAGRMTHTRDAESIALPANEVAGFLRIGGALRAAHRDEIEERSPEAQGHEWNWIVKPLPMPPLAVLPREELDDDDLLANDSLGG